MEWFIAKRPITGKTKNGHVSISVGARVGRAEDGSFSVNRTHVESIIPAVIRCETIRFTLNPMIAASDLDPHA